MKTRLTTKAIRRFIKSHGAIYAEVQTPSLRLRIHKNHRNRTLVKHSLAQLLSDRETTHHLKEGVLSIDLHFVPPFDIK